MNLTQALQSQRKAKGRFPVAPKAERSIDGIVFASKREMVRWGFLVLLQRSGKIRDLERQPSWVVTINGKPLCRFTADFRYFSIEQDRVVIEEIKSSGTAKDTAYRLRRKAAELAHGIVVTEIAA